MDNKRKKKARRRYYLTKRRRFWLKVIRVSILIAIIELAFIIGQITSLTYVYASPVIQNTVVEEVVETKYESVEGMIRRLADEANFQWPDYLVRLAKCESTLNPNATNSVGNSPEGSVDRGLFQLNDYWHPVSDSEAFDPVFATKYAMDLINQGRQAEFVCDRKI